MIYVDNDSTYSQLIYIPRGEDFDGATGHTFSLQRKDYVINNNGLVHIHPDGGYDGISGGTISVYVSAATGVTFEGLEVTENGIYVPSGDTAYSGVTVNVDTQGFYDEGYDEGYQDGKTEGYTSGYTSGHTDGFNEGYASGYTDGYASGRTDGYNEGYASGRTQGYGEGYASGKTDGFASGYTEGSKDGYSEGYTSGSTDGYREGYNVGFAAGYTSGHTDGYTAGYNAGLLDGAANQKALLTSETIVRNGEYTRENGWSALTVNVPDGGYQEGFDEGVEHQKSLLGFHNFTANTGSEVVVFPDGLSGVTVNIPFMDLDVTATTNGDYDYIGGETPYTRVHFTVAVEQTGSTPTLISTAFTENGSYSPPAGVDGFSTVFVGVNTAQTFNDGYASGVTDGYNSGYTEGVEWRNAQDSAGTFTANGTYTRPDGFGWNEVNVNVPTAATYNSGYTSGYTDGSNYQKSLLGSTAFTENGTYTKQEGWSAVTVNLDTGATYNSGYTEGYSSGRTRGYSEGVAAQKGLLTAETFTENGTYTRANGWNEVTVNVPTTQVVTLTQAEYNALAVKDNYTIYLILD